MNLVGDVQRHEQFLVRFGRKFLSRAASERVGTAQRYGWTRGVKAVTKRSLPPPHPNLNMRSENDFGGTSIIWAL